MRRFFSFYFILLVSLINGAIAAPSDKTFSIIITKSTTSTMYSQFSDFNSVSCSTTSKSSTARNLKSENLFTKKIGRLFGLAFSTVATKSGTLFSRAAGDIKASEGLLTNMQAHGRTITFAAEGSEELRFLNAMKAEASVGGSRNMNMILRPNPSKIAALEEYLHGTQTQLGIIDRLGIQEAEDHMASFLLRHSKILGLE